MNLFKLSLKPLLMGLALLLPLGAFADVEDYALFLPGIEGTETIGGFNDLIPIEAFFIVKPFFVDARRTDSTTPLLESAAANKQRFSSATIYAFDSAAGAPTQLSTTYTFSDVVAAADVHFGLRQEASLFAYSKLAVSTRPIGPVSAPELDVSSAASGATLLAGCLLVLSARRPRKNKSAQAALA